MKESEIITIIQKNILRCLTDKFPQYDRDVAVYNDLLREINPSLVYEIAFDGKDAKLIGLTTNDLFKKLYR